MRSTPRPPTTLLDAGPTTLAPIPELSRPVRIVVAGDSTAVATGGGLVAWAAANPDLAQVEIVAELGCGFVRGGEVMLDDWTKVERRCDEWLDETLPARVEALAPDVVMMMTTSWDVLDRRWPETGEVVPSDPSYRERIVRDIADVSNRLAVAGSQKVVWVREPIPNVYWWSSGQAQEDPARHAEIYAAMAAAAESSGGRVVVVDLPAWLAEHGLDVDEAARPDGVHWSPEASLRIADEFLGEQLVRAALTPVAADDRRWHVITVYTDGACSGNPGPGGWAWAVAPDGEPNASGGEPTTTNQRMELRAALEALRTLAPSGETIRVVSDSLVRREVLHRQVVGEVGAQRLAQHQEAAGRQRRPVEAARRVRARRQRRVGLGEGPQRRPSQRPRRPPGRGGHLSVESCGGRAAYLQRADPVTLRSRCG